MPSLAEGLDVERAIQVREYRYIEAGEDHQRPREAHDQHTLSEQSIGGHGRGRRLQGDPQIRREQRGKQGQRQEVFHSVIDKKHRQEKGGELRVEKSGQEQ